MKVQSLKEVILGNKKDLMGVAIILIMCYHIELGGIIENIRPLHFLKELCDVGVDIFIYRLSSLVYHDSLVQLGSVANIVPLPVLWA